MNFVASNEQCVNIEKPKCVCSYFSVVDDLLELL